jgi:DNA-binding response OmpR family regulator
VGKRVDPAGVFEHRVRVYERGTRKAPEVSMSSKKVLVVDDEKHIRMLYQEELESEGYVVSTSDGEEPILATLEREKPAVVVLDIKLGPNRSGLDLLQEIRGKDQVVPVILSTAYDSFQHDLKSIAADYYVVKSVDLTELKTKVAMALSKTAEAK